MSFKIACPKCHWGNEQDVQMLFDKTDITLMFDCKNKKCKASILVTIPMIKWSEMVPA